MSFQKFFVTLHYDFIIFAKCVFAQKDDTINSLNTDGNRGKKTLMFLLLHKNQLNKMMLSIVFTEGWTWTSYLL